MPTTPSMISLVVFLSMAAAYGVASYVSTRGPDGNLKLAMVSFAAIGLAQVVATVWLRTPIWQACLWAIVFELCVVAPFFVPPKLEEMGGMLCGVLPAAVAVASLVSVVAAFFRS